MAQHFLAKRGSQWQFYRRVPTDLVDEIGCRFWRESLRTDSRKLAEQRVVAHVHRTNLLIDAARSGTLPDETISETAYAWRWSGIDLGHAAFSEIYDLRDEVAESIRRYVEAKKVRVKQPEDWDRLIAQCIRELDDGDDEGALSVRHPDRNVSEDRLSKVFERYSAELKDELGGKTLPEWATAVRRFVSLHGDLPIRTITRSKIEQFQHALRKLPARPGDAIRKLDVAEQIKWAEGSGHPLLSPASVAKNITAIKSILDFAFKQTSLIPDEVRATWRNPCEGFVGQRKKDRRTKLRKPFKPEHIPVIFDHTAYGRAIKQSPARFWLPLLLHYTGARLTEIAQVTLNDVHVQDEIVWLTIHEESDHAVAGDRKSVKNDDSERSLPLHEDLFRIGFKEYVDWLRASGHVRLFPELPHEKREERASDISKWFGRYRTRRGFSGEHVLHSFRHSFKQTALRSVEMKESLLKMFQGHHLPDVADSVYGAHARHDAALLKQQVLDRMEFPRINLDGLAEVASELRIEHPEATAA